MNLEGRNPRRIRGTRPEHKEAARALRQPLTPAEHVLWQALRDRKLAGLKFRRQHAVGAFILDFYCPAHKLVVELDGGIHHRQAGYDEARSAHLSSYGYRLIRFRNEEVLADLPSVLQRIRDAVRG